MRGGYIKYALIGLAPNCFHYDQSLTTTEPWRLLQYYIVFKDLHNFFLSPEEYGKLFREEFLKQKFTLENFDTNNVYLEKRFVNPQSWNEKINARRVIDAWKIKNYPETVKEYTKILDEYLTLCENNNVRPIMFLPPMTEAYMKYFSRQKISQLHYLISEAQKKHPTAGFLDGWKLDGFSDKDFADVDHLNLKGAAKFSAILNNAIESLEKG